MRRQVHGGAQAPALLQGLFSFRLYPEPQPYTLHPAQQLQIPPWSLPDHSSSHTGSIGNAGMGAPPSQGHVSSLPGPVAGPGSTGSMSPSAASSAAQAVSTREATIESHILARVALVCQPAAALRVSLVSPHLVWEQERWTVPTSCLGFPAVQQPACWLGGAEGSYGSHGVVCAQHMLRGVLVHRSWTSLSGDEGQVAAFW